MVCNFTKGDPMKNTQNKMPPAIAWDFRKVDDFALEDATRYEYARSSDMLRNAIWECLQTKIEGKRINQHILAAMVEGQKSGNPYPDCFPDGVFEKASEGLEKATRGNFKLLHIIMHKRPDFPAPWTDVAASAARFEYGGSLGWPAALVSWGSRFLYRVTVLNCTAQNLNL